LFRSRCQVSKRRGNGEIRAGHVAASLIRLYDHALRKTGYFLFFFFILGSIHITSSYTEKLLSSVPVIKGKRGQKEAFSRVTLVEKEGAIWQFSVLL
jgi:hypothetical protein